jgi:hypothetical protein
MNRAFTIIIALAVAFVLAVSGPAQAEVLVADSFSYSDGDLVPNNGGYSMDANNQWSGAWVNWSGGAADPGDIVVSGNQVTAGLDFIVNQGVERPIDNNQGATTQYIGFDLKHYGPTAANEMFGVGLDPAGGSGPDAYALGVIDGDNWKIHANVKSGGTTGPTAYAPGAWHRVVMRLDFDKGGSNEELTVWVDAALETDTPEITHHSQNMGSSLDGLSLVLYGRKNFADPPTWGLDRLNLTTTFEDARDGIIFGRIPGDVNGDGWVGGVDLNRVINNWGQTGLGREGGDLNDNGTVDGPDYSEIQSYWGTSQPLEPPSAVPEPGTLILLMIGGLVVLRRRSVSWYSRD